MSVIARRSRPARRQLAAALLVTIATGTAASIVPAQSTNAPAASVTAAAPARDECFAFTFGGWTPPLDARAAGHEPVRSSDATQQAPHGRDWAMRLETRRDTTLMLFPAWWPTGVAVRFPQGIETTHDTARGTATALVADGRATPPRAPVLLWRVPCGGP